MLSTVFTFAPVPLTEETSPLSVAADLAKRRQADIALNGSASRHRIHPASRKISLPGVGLVAA